METSSKADSPGGVDQVTKSRICRDSFKETSEIFVEKVDALNEHNGNSALHMYFGVPDDDHLPDNVREIPDLTDQCSWTLLCTVHCFQSNSMQTI